MHIKSIVLDGFKSYGNRVEITGFDPEFNAITGLNGTGKSNILDSICFVLGITNLSNVRAGSLQELIYKHGQAGITKATVSITFENRDKRQCPIGYENQNEITVTRQVVMGGKNKYLINGINVQNRRVSDLFCSVQLNVNNPHFLIMQGRITKVLNMKPPEILSMVEEAAGTRMYETKKQAAQKTIEKKDAKLRELNDIIKEDIAPKLQKLQDERAQFQEYQKVVRELENLSRLHIAWKYVTTEEGAKEATNKLSEVKNDIESKKEAIKNNEKEAKQLDKQITELNKKLDEESGSVLKQLETQLAEDERIEAEANSAYKEALESVTTQERALKQLHKNRTDDIKALQEKRSVLDRESTTFSSLKSASEVSAAALATAQQRFVAVSSGLEGDGEAGQTLQDRLMDARQEASEASTRIAQSTMEKKYCDDRLKSLKREFQSSSSQFQKDQDDIGRMQTEVNRLQAELNRMNYSEERNVELKNSVRSLQSTIRSQRDAVDRLSAGLQRCQFNYTDPERNFDRGRVFGTVCKLFEVRDFAYCTGLETAAGGKLYNVVVDTPVTGQLLLKSRLRTRTTVIPLSKISSHVIDAATVKLAQQVGGGSDKVQLALDLVTYPEQVKNAMKFVFGQTFICKDMETAKKVTFHPRIKRRCVTLDGDVFDPSGTLAGGARSKTGPVLPHLAQLRELEQQLQAAELQLQQSTSELNNMQQATEKHQRLEMMSHELEAVKSRVASTAHAQLHKEIQELEQRASNLTATVEEDKVKQKEATAKAKDLESKVKDIKGHREREFKKAEDALKKAKQEAEKSSKLWEQREQEFETLRLEVAELEEAVASSEEKQQELHTSIQLLKAQLEEAQNEQQQAKESVKKMQDDIKKHKSAISGKNSDIAKLIQRKEALSKLSGEHDLKVKELQYRIDELKTEAADYQKKLAALESEHAWIAGEREQFGAAGGAYDWGGGGGRGAGGAGGVAGARLAQLRERRDKLQRGLNARAHTLLGKEEELYQDVMRKKKIVEADRAKLLQVIAELDEKKKRTLVTACEQVNKDFGSIFSTLLPGAQACLQPPPGFTVLDGLEVKVGFNGTWKESLGELSGGQRSLVALSLVLAMLLFKPAPLYILDEVDAALDLNHTQNIGQMLHRHFKHSQFIVVSLKDGMFNNANVLFRTRFVDGMSSVERTVNSRKNR